MPHSKREERGSGSEAQKTPTVQDSLVYGTGGADKEGHTCLEGPCGNRNYEPMNLCLHI
jgi:hypothetical protein